MKSYTKINALNTERNLKLYNIINKTTMKTINFELSKRLNELWLLNNIETEYKLWEYWVFVITWFEPIVWPKLYKTLTLEEAIEFLPNWISMQKDWWDYIYYYVDYIWNFVSSNHIEAIEKMIEYLLDNKLLW